MKTINVIRLAFTGALLFVAGAALAQMDDQANDQADVWAQIELQWNMAEKKDAKWIDRLLTEDFSGWSKDSPAPRGKVSTKMWTRFNQQVSEMLAHELYPLSIVVHDDVAVAHYMFTSADKQKTRDGKIETTHGRYTDILVRTDDGWKFLAWAGGAD